MTHIRKKFLCSMLFGVVYQCAAAVTLPGADIQTARQEAVRTVIVIDSAVQNYPDLIQAPALENSWIVLLKPGDNPIDAIGKALYGKKIHALHIVSHGGPGQLLLANRVIDTGFLRAHRQSLGRWSQNLVASADILLYGCDVARGEAGRRFVNNLATLSGADVAASSNPTGHRNRHADWLLETRVGDIQTPVFVSLNAQRTWHGRLAFEELYTTAATGLDEGNGVGGSATYQMRDVNTDAHVADWRATVISTTTTVGFRIRAGEDDPRIANAAAGTTTIRWESFEPATVTPHPATYCINISDMDGSRGETVTVTKADIFSYTLSVPTNIQVTDNGGTLAFRGTTDNDQEADAVRLCLKELSTWDFTYSQSSGGDSAYSHDVDADFPFIGGVTANFGYTVTQSSGSPVLNESGTSVVFDVVLDYAPAGDVVINFGSSDPGEATVSPASLTFTGGNWNVVQTITVTGVDDALADGAQNSDITASVNDALSDDTFDPLGDVTITVTTADDETAGFTVAESGGSTSVGETGSTDTFIVTLEAPPVTDVVLNVSSGDIGEATVSPTSLTFTTGNWNIAQTVTVAGVDDALTDGTQNTTVTIAVNDAASDDNFDALPNQAVTISTLDDESNFSPTNILPVTQSLAEDGFILFNDGNSNKISIIDNAGENLEVTIGVANGALTLFQTTGLTFTAGDGAADAAMTFSGTVEDINSALDGLRYDPAADFNGNETLTISTSDEVLLSYELDANLQGYYKFDSGDPSGGSGPNGAPDGTLLDNATFVTDATRGDVLSLDGNNDGFDVATRFGQPTTFTLAAWVNVTGVDTNAADIINIGDNILIRADASTTNNWGDGVSATIRHAGDTFTIWESGQYIEDTGWRHVAFTYDNGTGMGRLYLDGTQVVSMTSATPIDWSQFGLTTRIGKHGNTNTTADFGGKIDDARIYNRALSTTEVSELYLAPTQATDTDTLTIAVAPVNDSPTGAVSIDNTTPQVTDTLTASNTLADVDGISSPISYQWRRDGINIGGATGSTYSVVATDIGAVISVTASYTDDDGTAESVSSAGTAAVVTNGNFTITESGGGTAVSESGTTDTFAVVLNVRPAGDVVIDVSSGDTGEATVSPSSLTFTNGNWNVAQTVTVTGVNDSIIDGTQNTTVTLSVNDASSDDNYDAAADKTVDVSTVDNDAAAFVIVESGGGTSVNESGTADTFTVVLTAQPNSDVVIGVSSGDSGEAAVNPASLTFTSGNWNVAQTVTVTGVDDTLVDGAQNTTVTVSINVAASDDNFDALADQTVTASTVDDDVAGFVVVESGGDTSVDESGTTDTFTVVLTAQPNSDVEIDVSSGDAGEATASPASLTFTNGNWNIEQTVTITGVNDALVDGGQNSMITLSVNAAASDNNFDSLADQTVAVSTTDDDSAGFAVTESGGSTSVSESGTTDTFTVVLTAQPNSDVVISLGSADTNEATVSPAGLTFTGGNWSVAQTVTVTGIDDALIDGARDTAITISVNDAASDDLFDPLMNQTVTVSTTDNDIAGFIVTESGGTTSVNESGTTDTFTVVLAARPDSDVVIDINSGDTGEATVSPAALTFTNGNWNVAQTVTVTGANDALIDGNRNTAVTVSINAAASDNNFDALSAQTVTVTTVDNDAAGFSVTESGGATSVNESGTTDTVTVVLSAQPDSDVVIDVLCDDTGEATVSPASLTFTNGNWNIAQTVTITGVDEALIDGNQNATVTLSVNDAASDGEFDPLADQTVTVTTVDNDAAGFTVAESGGTSVNESGSTDTFTVVLNTQPAGNVVLDIFSGDTGEATVSPASLTFNTGNWNVAQTVTVTGVDDALLDGPQNTTVTVSVNDAGSDDDYDPLTDQTVTVTTTDDDAAGFTLVEAGGGTSVNESGTTDTFTVVLTAQPGSDVVIDVSSGDTGEATVSPASLTFTNGNWSAAQTVTVTGVDDPLMDGDQTAAVAVSINAAASDDAYDPLPDQTVTVTTVDDDAAGFTVIESGGNTAVNESGTTDMLMVALTVQPAGNVVLDISSGDTGEATVSPASLTFTGGNWNVAQAVTVTGIDDVLIDGNQSAAITLIVNDAASDNNFDPLPDRTVTVTVVDDDASPDADNDGIPNVVEGLADADFDGTPNFLDADSDNDGIPDYLEADNIPPLTGVDADSDGIDDVIDVDFTGGVDMNADGVDDAFEPDDSDGDGASDYLDVDSDNDGIPDGIEADNMPALAGSDADGDGIDDALDVDLTGGPDANSNGVDDRYEPLNPDGDGLADYLDIDSDNDGIHDSIEGGVLFADSDGDGLDDRYDVDITGGADIDGDGADDSAATDSDNDGRPDYRDLDSDNDGLSDVTEAGLTDIDGDGFADNAMTTLSPLDTDVDGTADYRDPDSDNHGAFDIVATGHTQYDVNNDGRIDAGFFVDPDDDGVPSVIDPAPAVFGLLNNGDGDGVPDTVDMDDDNDGIPDAIESPGGADIDSDGDGVADRLDRDSDNDGIPDSAEAFYSSEQDGDLDGVIDDMTDTNLDGLADVVPAAMAPEDTDGDGNPDYRDLDSDNDGLYDLLELTPADYNGIDADRNGRIDNPADGDGDGLANEFDPDSGNNPPLQIPDSDSDGVADFRDTDSDNDGFDDGLENGDFNGNGIMDFIESGRGITTSIPNGGGGGSFGWLWLAMLLLFYRQKKIRKRA